MSKFIDITGETYGRWKVLYKCDYKANGGATLWHCRCSCDKHTERDIRGTQLRNGRSLSCGCLANDRARETNAVDILGNTYGRLSVVKDAGYKLVNGKNRRHWLCKCSCGNPSLIEVAQDRLVSGNISSCGCLKKQTKPSNYVDLTGNKYGNLTVRHRDYTRNGRTYWICDCACGNKGISVDGDKLKRGLIFSCGCSNIAIMGSHNENIIRDFLLSKISHIDMILHDRTILDGKEIDIYIPSLKLGIEYNGSAFHSSENNIHSNKPIHYHQQKFLLAKSKGINLITIFDKDFESNYDMLLNMLSLILHNEYCQYIPHNDVEYTDNKFGTNKWMKDFGYVEIGQEEPKSFMYQNKYLVYDCGRTIWKKKF